MFETTRRVLTKDAKSPQAQVNHFLAEFVYKNDSKDTMLIIYYAGHGRPGNSRGNLRLTAYVPTLLVISFLETRADPFANRSISLPGDTNGELHEIVWESAETNIRETKADVLVIFDCCHAGELERSVRGHWKHRAFEYLAATSAKSTTRKPGPRSFTRALIWSLNHLAETRPFFSTTELLRTIHNEAPHFPRKQCPRLSEGQLPAKRKIMIAPLTSESKTRAAEAASQAPSSQREDEADDSGEERSHDFLLRFVFDCDITEEMLKTIASHIKDLIKGGEINAKDVAWEGINGVNYRDAVIAQPWLRHFAKSLSVIRRRGGSGERSPIQDAPGVLLSAASDAVSSPGFEMFAAATPEPARRSAEVEIGEDQGASAEKPLSHGLDESEHGALQMPERPGSGDAVPDVPHRRRSKRKQPIDEDGVHGSSSAPKRGRVGRKG